jgi:thiamine transport system permease protein
LRLKRVLLWSAPVVFMLVLFYWPLLNVFFLALGPDIAGMVHNESSVWPVLWFTVWQAFVSTAICLIIGIPGAYVLYRKSFRGSHFLQSIITVPFMLPSLVVAIAVTEVGALIGGIDPVIAIILANVFANYAVVVRNIGSQWQTLSKSTEEYSEVSGIGRFKTALRVSLPQLKSSIRASSAIIMLYCASSYGIVLSLGGGQVNTLETAISISVLERLDFAHGALLALLQIAFCLLAFIVSRWGGTNPLSFSPSFSKSKKLDRRDAPAATFTFLVIGFLVVVPIVLVLSKAFVSMSGSLSLENFALLDTRGSRDILNITFFEATLNSLRNLLVATAVSIVLGVLVAYLLAEQTRRRRKRKTDFLGITLDAAFLLPIGVSSVVIGVGYLITLTGDLAWIRTSWILVPLVQSVFAIPLVVRIAYPSLVAVDSNTREQAMTDGASGLQLFVNVDYPLLRPVMKTAIAFSALVSLGEFGVASLLTYGDQATIPVLMYQLISRPGAHNYGMALAVASILTLLTTLIVLLISQDGSKKSQKTLARF